MQSARNRVLLGRARVAQPIDLWGAPREPEREYPLAWGEDSQLIEDWFDAGDNHHCATELVIEARTPDRWDRALDWVRSVAVATKLIPA